MQTKLRPFTIRPARLPEEAAALAGFIDALQHYERAIESNRRVDSTVGEDYYRVLMNRVAENEGRVFVAEGEGRLLGWMVTLVEESPAYIVEEERRAPQVAELYLIEDARGQGAGTALLEIAEADFRARGYRHMMIGVLPQNAPAVRAYERFGFKPYMEMRRKRF